jgi:hypothetical protein
MNQAAMLADLVRSTDIDLVMVAGATPCSSNPPWTIFFRSVRHAGSASRLLASSTAACSLAVDRARALEVFMHFFVAAEPAVTDDVRELAEDVGDDRAGQLGGAGPASAQLVSRFSAESRVREGDEIEVAIDARAQHFFDVESGLAIYDA